MSPEERQATGAGASAGGAARGRPRSEAVERSIIEAVVHLLEQGTPLAELSVEGVARAARVGKATIYRRWSGKEALFVDVMKTMEPADPPLPGTSVRDDLLAMLESLRQRGLAKQSSMLIHSVFAQMKTLPKLWAAYHDTVVEGRRAAALAVIRRGMETGEIRADLDPGLVNDLVFGPILVRSVLRSDGELPAELPAEIVDAVMRGIGPR
ncbi:TetR/AcrR family transcriptional regulator [Streptomyces sp. NPDC060194]|uniref:TetR/AcrR family transcriptional regulator n=1 Tax=Streptomyces sp. NPDC060194 TaxID=3347069 RepID=UPI0036500008